MAQRPAQPEEIETGPTWRRTLLYLLPLIVALGGIVQYWIMTSDPVMIMLHLKPAPQSSGPTAYERSLSLDEVKIVQFAVGESPADGVVGSETRALIKTYQERAGLPVTGMVDRSVFDQMMADVDAEWEKVKGAFSCNLDGAMNTFECLDLSPYDLDRMQQALHIPSGLPMLDGATRNAIQRYAAEHLIRDNGAKAGQLSPYLLHEILQSKN